MLALKAYRDSTTHSSATIRKPVEDLFAASKCIHVTCFTAYRVCHRSDAVFGNHHGQYGQYYFVSACKTMKAAQQLLARPPNALADMIVKLAVMGPVIHMAYGDDYADKTKEHECEVIVLLSGITHAHVIQVRTFDSEWQRTWMQHHSACPPKSDTCPC